MRAKPAPSRSEQEKIVRFVKSLTGSSLSNSIMIVMSGTIEWSKNLYDATFYALLEEGLREKIDCVVEKKIIKFTNGSEVRFISTLHGKDVNSLRGIEYDFVRDDGSANIDPYEWFFINSRIRGYRRDGIPRGEK